MVSCGSWGTLKAQGDGDEAACGIADVLVVAVARLRQQALRKRTAAVFIACEADVTQSVTGM